MCPAAKGSLQDVSGWGRGWVRNPLDKHLCKVQRRGLSAVAHDAQHLQPPEHQDFSSVDDYLQLAKSLMTEFLL